MLRKQNNKQEHVETTRENGDIKTEDNPYAYLERGEFSSENFKIEIKNLPKHYGIGELRKLLNEKLELKSSKIKTPKHNSKFAFVCFRSEDDREQALNTLNGYKWKGQELLSIKAKASADPLVQKRKQDYQQQSSSKKFKVEGKTQEERLKFSTIPLWNVDYKEQLEMKQRDIRDILRRLGNDLGRHNAKLRKWLEEQKTKFNGLPCELLNIRYSEQIDGYRNKCEFTVGMDEETNLPTVGFRIGAYVNGITGVGPVESLKHIPDSMKKAVKVFESFVRSSDLKVFNPEIQTGHFRQLCVRTAPEQLMIIVGIHPQDLTPEHLTEFKKSLVDFFVLNDEGKSAKVTSLYYQDIVKKSRGEDSKSATHLWGETHIYETLHGLKFRISPEAFFQVNTSAAEILYNSVIEFAEPTETSTILDVCCGTGTIGLCFAKKCNQILGLEVVEHAIKDAKENAKLNNIENGEFFVGQAEKILGTVCYESKNPDVIAIVDPPRAGLHQKAILQLRKRPTINKLVYVSCNPCMALKNFVDLGRPESKTLHGEAFVPIKAVAVDMFPHTKHCELVICFKRWDHIDIKPKVEVKTEETSEEMVESNDKNEGKTVEIVESKIKPEVKVEEASGVIQKKEEPQVQVEIDMEEEYSEKDN